ncbi:MAG: activator of HSP90 ATPase [Cellulomonadaceae bacterium]|nr:activator of HSP90 ATPase [Cellulomonadaceae bacterium]
MGPAAGTEPIEREIHLAAPLHRVWDVLTRAEHLGAWFADAGAVVDLRVGGLMLLRWHGYGTFRARFDAVERPHRLTFRWSEAADSEPVPGVQTTVDVQLAADGDGTRLTLVESAFETLQMNDHDRAAHRLGNLEGWREELDELTAYLASLPE